MNMSNPLPDEKAEGPRAPQGAVAALRRDDFDRDVWCVMGLPVDAMDITRALSEIDAAARTRQPLSFITPNVNFLVRAMKDETARREILNADLSLADGAPLVWMAKMLGAPVTARVAGSDLFEALRRRPAYAGRPLKVFLFGGRAGAAEAAFKALNGEKAGVEAVGWHKKRAAEILEIPVGTVRSRLFRARRRLQDFLIEQARDMSKVLKPVYSPLGGWRARNKRK